MYQDGEWIYIGETAKIDIAIIDTDGSSSGVAEWNGPHVALNNIRATQTTGILVEWGDGTSQWAFNRSTSSPIHQYKKPGNYTIKISCPFFCIGWGDDGGLPFVMQIDGTTSQLYGNGKMEVKSISIYESSGCEALLPRCVAI